MHLKSLNENNKIESSYKLATNMASSLLNDDEDNATRNTQQQQQQQNNNNNLNETSSNGPQSTNANKMQDNEAKLKKQNLEQRKQELEKLLNEKSWLLQQLQKQESQILNGNFEYMNFNEFVQNLAAQYKQEQNIHPANNNNNAGDNVSSLSGTGSNHLTAGEEAILRRKPLMAKENQQHLHNNNNNNNNNVLHRRQSEISNRSSEYDNYPQQDNHSTHSEGTRGGGAAVMHGAAQATQQYAAKAALKKRSATVAGTTAQSSTNLQMIRQQHLEQQQQQLLYKQQQQQQHYHHPQQHLFKPHIDHHQVLMPHLQYATQKFYYTTLQPQANPPANQQQQTTQQQATQQQQQPQYGRYIQNKQIAQQQTMHHNHLNPQQQQLLLTPPSGSSITIDNISLYSLNSNNVATLHRPAQQQQPIIVQCDKYYLSPTSHHVSHNDGGGFIKSSQNIKEYISPLNSPPQHLALRDTTRSQTSQSTNLNPRGATPALDVISLAPSYVSMETIDYELAPVGSNIRWRSQSNLPPSNTNISEIKSQSSDMLNNNQYYNTALNPPPPPNPPTLVTQQQTLIPPPHVTQVKPFKPLDDISTYSNDSHKKLKPKQWLESSLDGPVIRQTPSQEEPPCSTNSFNSPTNSQTRSKLSSQSLNTSRHYSMSSAQTKANLPQNPSNNITHHNKLSQSTSYLNQLDFTNANNTPTLPTTSTTTPSISQAYNIELSPQSCGSYKYITAPPPPQPNAAAPPPAARIPASALYVNTSHTNLVQSATPTPPLAAALSPDIRIESPVNMTVVQPATFQPYKEVTKPFEMSDFYKYSTKFRQKENNGDN